MIATVIIALIIAAAAVMIAVNYFKKNGQGGCSCGCGSCAMSEICHKEK